MWKFALFMMLITVPTFAQELYDNVVVYFKDGSTRQGMIVDKADESVTLLIEKQRYVYPMNAILTIKKSSGFAPVYIPSEKQPVVGCVLSAVIPGAGQAYNEQYGKAVVFFAGYAVCFGYLITSYERDIFDDLYLPKRNEDRPGIAFLGMIGIQVLSMIEAVASADDINKQNAAKFSLSPITAPKELGAVLSLRF